MTMQLDPNSLDITSVDTTAEEGYTYYTITQHLKAPSRAWVAYLKLIRDIPTYTKGYLGDYELDVEFLPSGTQMTSQANTVVSYNIACEFVDHQWTA